MPHAEKRVLEAAKLGYKRAVVPAASAVKSSERLKSIKILSCPTIADAFDAVFGDGFSSKQKAAGKVASPALLPERDVFDEGDF